MRLMILDFIANLFFVIFPLFLYQLFCSNDGKSKKHQALYFIFGVAVIILVMTFPIHIKDGYIFDLRYVPIIIGFLYGGLHFGIPFLILSTAYRYQIGGDGLQIAMFVNILLFITLTIFGTFFKSLTFLRKIIVVFLTALVQAISLMIAFNVFKSFSVPFLVSNLVLFVIELFSLSIVVYLIEKIHNDKHLRDRLIHTEKLELVSQLAASISHEIRNPLTVSRGFIQLMQEQDFPAATKKEYIGLALKEMDRANEIITDYLAFAKPALEKPEKIDVYTEVNKMLEIIKPYANMQSVDIDIKLERDLFVIGERQKFYQGIINIAKNGIEAMPNGGILKIKAVSINNNFVYLSVSDSGIGMKHEEIERLGKPYFSTKEKGTGLGMMVTYSIIKAMKGTIKVESKKGRGTTFNITIPQVK